MFARLNELREFETDLVIGYLRTNYNRYIANEVAKLLMLYVWVLDEFDCNRSSQNIKIKGINNNICECISDDKCTTLSRNIISLSQNSHHNYYHWQFKILSVKSINTRSDVMTFIVGITEELSDVNSCVNSAQYHTKKNDILDMYLNLNKGVLFVIVNNNKDSRIIRNIDTSVNYRMKISLLVKEMSVQLISYHHSKFYNINNNNNVLNLMGFSRSISSVDEKIKYLEIALKSHPNMSELHNDYINCLVIKNEYEKAYDYIIKNNVKQINMVCNIVRIGHCLFYVIKDYEKAFNIYSLIKDDNILMEYDLCFQMACCYHYSNPRLSIKYYLLRLKYNDKYSDATLTNIAIIYEEIGEFKNALKYYFKLKESDISSNNLEENIAFCFQREKDWDNALLWYYKHKQKCPNDHKCLFRIARIYKYMNNFEKANEYFDTALNMAKEGEQYDTLLRNIAMIYVEIGEYKNALLWYNKHKQRCPNDPKCLVRIAELYIDMNNFEKAEQFFNTALNMDKAKNSYYVHYKYFLFLRLSNPNSEKAKLYFEKALNLASNNEQKAECFSDYGFLLFRIGNMNKAIEYTQKSLELNGKCVQTVNNLGYYYLVTEQYELSYKYLNMALEIKPNYDLTNGNLANCLCAMNRFDEAIPYLEISLAKESDLNHSDVAPLCLQNYAHILYMKKDYIKCESIYEQLIKREEFISNENKDKIYYLISNNCQKLFDFDKALHYAMKAVTIKPSNEQYQKNIHKIKQKMYFI